MNGGINKISFENTYNSVRPCTLCMVTTAFQSFSTTQFLWWLDCVVCTCL